MAAGDQIVDVRGEGAGELAYRVEGMSCLHCEAAVRAEVGQVAGHLVALREGDLAFLHVHPDAEGPRCMATFPSVGTYRPFLQLKTGGRLHTVAFTRQVRP